MNKLGRYSIQRDTTLKNIEARKNMLMLDNFIHDLSVFTLKKIMYSNFNELPCLCKTLNDDFEIYIDNKSADTLITLICFHCVIKQKSMDAKLYFNIYFRTDGDELIYYYSEAGRYESVSEKYTRERFLRKAAIFALGNRTWF